MRGLDWTVLKQSMLKPVLAITGLLALTAVGHVYGAPVTLLCV